MKLHLCQKNSLIRPVLRLTLVFFFSRRPAKNSKYLFYQFNDFVKVYGNLRYNLLHTKKMLDSVGLKKNKQFLIEKIIHEVESENQYNTIFLKKSQK